MPAERIKFFSAPTLRFSPPSSFNDVFDCAFINKEIFSEKYLADIASKHGIKSNQNTNKDIVSGVYASGEIQKIINNFDESFNYNIGILSLTSSIENEAMWGVYATNEKKAAHTGFAIGLNTSHSFFKRQKGTTNLFWRLIKVAYTQGINPSCLSDHFGENTDSILLEYIFKKGKKWEFEDEWRMVTVPSIVPNDGLSGIVEIKPDMISGVYLGIMADTSLIYRAKLFCDSFDIPLFQMQCNRQARTLIPVPLSTVP